MTAEEKKALVDEFKTLTIGNLMLESEKAGLTVKQYIQNSLRDGVSADEIKAVLITDLRDGGQIFGSFRKSFRQTVTNNVEKTARDAMIQIQEAESRAGEARYDWILEPSANNCADCVYRSGLTMTMDEWRAIGLPQAGMTLCGQYCQCELVQSGVFTPDMVAEVKERYLERKQI